jgi:uncharacterized protein
VAFFALADLHLGFAVDKPMDIFGDQWCDHPAKIEANWRRVVTEDDIVLLPGDISWAMRFEQAEPDLNFIAALPGRKVLIRGNHDYWWSSIGKVREALPDGMFALQNDHLVLDGVALCGTRGWNLPGGGLPGNDDPKHFVRERNRLQLSLESAPAGLPKIALLHYPPRLTGMDDPGFTDLLEEQAVRICAYGHLHGAADHRLGIAGRHGGVEYVLCAADAVDFTPVRLPDERVASA